MHLVERIWGNSCSFDSVSVSLVRVSLQASVLPECLDIYISFFVSVCWRFLDKRSLLILPSIKPRNLVFIEIAVKPTGFSRGSVNSALLAEIVQAIEEKYARIDLA